MNCNQAQAGLSLAIDGELPADQTGPLRVHVIACPACTRFNDQLRAIRHGLRFEALGEVPDVAPRVLTAIRGTRRPRRRRLSPVAAAFLAGAILGATFIGVGGGRPTRVANANLPERVVAAQHAVISVAADLRLVERGWHQGIRERLFTGRLRYHAPESLQVQLVDRTPYPSAAWVRSDMELVVTGDRWWMRAPRACPVEALRVVATAGAERDHWAASRGYHDTPGSALLELTLDHVALNRSLPPGSFPSPTAGVAPEDDDFIDGLPGTSTVPAPKWLPAGFRRYRDGIVATRGGPTVAVRTWTDGRAWVKVRATRDWPGGRLFGDLGQLVRPVTIS